MGNKALITGSSGLIGSACCREFAQYGWEITGVDCDARKQFFLESASTRETGKQLAADLGEAFTQANLDIREDSAQEDLHTLAKGVDAIIHCAGQPSHEWSANNPREDFRANAISTVNLLDIWRKTCPEAKFIFLSTNKVYGNTPNSLEMVEKALRWEPRDTNLHHGFQEVPLSESCLKSPFGASKAAADLMTLEYANYYGMEAATLRLGCVTGSAHQGVEAHGFLSYMARTIGEGKPYKIFGYKGKQVRDTLQATDAARAIRRCATRRGSPMGTAYNLGGGPYSTISVLEALDMFKEISGKTPNIQWGEHRKADHIWWATNNGKFKRDHPDWMTQKPLWEILEELAKQWIH